MTSNTIQPESATIVRDIELTNAEVAFYKDQGFLPLPGFVHAAQIHALHEEILDVLQANGITRTMLSKATTKADKLRQCSQYLANSRIDALINGPQTLAVASRLIGGKAVRYMPFTAVKAAGGGGK
ncbi:MAG: hypothetical protein HC898_07080, partial [Phycisphaerales bacterium]|nr:hypothetical protein [Phycisphaerales bacterium]